MFAGILGFTCTLSITNAKPLNGILGMVSALIYIVVAINAKNYNDVLLQSVYILTLDLPVLLMPAWAKDVKKKVAIVIELNFPAPMVIPAIKPTPRSNRIYDLLVQPFIWSTYHEGLRIEYQAMFLLFSIIESPL